MTTIDLSDQEGPRFRWRALAVWTTAVLIHAVVLHLQIALPFGPALLTSAVYFYTLALLMIPVRNVSARLLDSGRGRWTLFMAHVGMAAVAIAVWLGVHLLFHRLAVGPDFWQLVYAGSWLFQLLSACAIYAAAVGVTVASLAFERDRERTRRQHQLEVAARDAELLALRAQFQPHYVLNALNSLLALIDADPALARTMVSRLADLMRSVFERVDAELVPLEHELEAIRAYLDVESIRFGTRLSVTFTIDEAARGVLVPPFLLQPVVENAVKHGVAPFAGPGRIDVTARVVDDQLWIAVRDSALRPVTGSAPVAGTGRGLQLTRRRLDGAYGPHYGMTFDAHADGAEVEIHLPAEGRGAA